MKLPFNIPFIPANKLNHVLTDRDILRTQGKYYQACKKLIKKSLGFEEVILTPSCTSALELIALTLNIEPGDEVILPSYTYVSTANAFALRGAKLIFVDTYSFHPSIDINQIESLITKKTKAIVVVHYGGIATDYAALVKLKSKYSIPIVEDAAHCFGAKSHNLFIGSVGDFAAFSFHETKNISCGQGGAVVINNLAYLPQANIVAQCGTDKIDFINKKVGFYSWKNLGSNFLLAEPLCAILLASLKWMEKINKRRIGLWENYYNKLRPLELKGYLKLPPHEREGNGHIFYLITRDPENRDDLIQHLRLNGIEATFHYYPLHLSGYYLDHGGRKSLKNTEYLNDRIIRLPLFYELTPKKQDLVVKSIFKFYCE